LFSNSWLIFSLVQECLDQFKCLPLDRTASRRTLKEKVLICNPVRKKPTKSQLTLPQKFNIWGSRCIRPPFCNTFWYKLTIHPVAEKTYMWLNYTETKNYLAKLFTAKTKSQTKTM
jgi:hypothetical protein